MKTIIFYSYKGGTGKTLAACNLAVCLSRLGKHCALIDMDFDSPSVHYKFEGDKLAPTSKGGFIKYILSHVKGDLWPKKQSRILKFKSLENLDNYEEILPLNYGEKKEGATNSLKGAIHLIPAGNAYFHSYWDHALSPINRRIYRIHKEREKDLIDEEGVKNCINFFVNIKSKISKLEPNPEYMIVDLRSGAQEIASTIMATWADTTICMFSLNDDSVDYISTFFSNMGHLCEIVPVLCRVPTGIDFRGDRQLRKLLDTLGRKSFDDLYVLHSDRNMEMMESLLLGYRNEPQNLRLTHDYLKLFSELIETKDIPMATEDNKFELLREAIGLPLDVHDQDRIFRLETDRGALINPNDNSRNVSFKVETFQLLLKGLEEGISEAVEQKDMAKNMRAGKISHSSKQKRIDKIKRKWFEDFLHSAGMKCGENFGRTIRESSEFWINVEEKYLGEEAKLRKWCTFDSDVGFGKFSLFSETVKIVGGKFSEGDIILRESFLTSANDMNLKETENHRYCSFMTGYIHGVLRQILNGKIKVSHPRISKEKMLEFFPWKESRSESCVFHVIRKP